MKNWQYDESDIKALFGYEERFMGMGAYSGEDFGKKVFNDYVKQTEDKWEEVEKKENLNLPDFEILVKWREDYSNIPVKDVEEFQEKAADAFAEKVQNLYWKKSRRTNYQISEYIPFGYTPGRNEDIFKIHPTKNPDGTFNLAVRFNTTKEKTPNPKWMGEGEKPKTAEELEDEKQKSIQDKKDIKRRQNAAKYDNEQMVKQAKNMLDMEIGSSVPNDHYSKKDIAAAQKRVRERKG